MRVIVDPMCELWYSVRDGGISNWEVSNEEFNVYPSTINLKIRLWISVCIVFFPKLNFSPAITVNIILRNPYSAFNNILHPGNKYYRIKRTISSSERKSNYHSKPSWWNNPSTNYILMETPLRETLFIIVYFMKISWNTRNSICMVIAKERSTAGIFQ
jgi:hypothetical protein